MNRGIESLGPFALDFLDDLTKEQGDGDERYVVENAIFAVSLRREDADGDQVGEGVAYRSLGTITYNLGLLKHVTITEEAKAGGAGDES